MLLQIDEMVLMSEVEYYNFPPLEPILKYYINHLFISFLFLMMVYKELNNLFHRQQAQVHFWFPLNNHPLLLATILVWLKMMMHFRGVFFHQDHRHQVPLNINKTITSYLTNSLMIIFSTKGELWFFSFLFKLYIIYFLFTMTSSFYSYYPGPGALI